MGRTNLLLFGNGADRALGMQTSYNDFISYLKNKIRKNLGSPKSKDFNKKDLEDLKHFIKRFEANHGLETADSYNWSDLEKDIPRFFVKNATPRARDFSRLQNGYYVLQKCMQIYYLKDIYDDIDNRVKSSKEVTSQIIAIYRFMERHNTININFNYTNFLCYTTPTKLKGISFNKINFYFPHMIIPALSFAHLIREMNVNDEAPKDPWQRLVGRNLNIGNIFTINGLSPLMDRFSDKRKLLTKQIASLNKAKWIKNQLILSDNFKKKTNVLLGSTQKALAEENVSDLETIFGRLKDGVKKITLPPVGSREKWIQAIILGSSKIEFKENRQLNFLSKDLNPFLFINDYPTNVFKDIGSSISEDTVLYVFGFSFGEGDEFFNNMIFRNINNGRIKEVIFLYFKKDEKIARHTLFPPIRQVLREKITGIVEVKMDFIDSEGGVTNKNLEGWGNQSQIYNS